MRGKLLIKEKAAARFQPLSGWDISDLSPYSTIFYPKRARHHHRNPKKANALPEPAPNTRSKCPANSLFINILQLSPYSSIFCREYRVVHSP